jgi:hypothetical protein
LRDLIGVDNYFATLPEAFAAIDASRAHGPGSTP